MAFLHLFLFFSLLVSTTLALNKEETPLSTATTLVTGPVQYNRDNFTPYFHQILERRTTKVISPKFQGYPLFGQLNILDVPLFDTSGTKQVARWQGYAVQSDVRTPGWHLSYNIVFSNANTIQVMGREPYRTTTIELSIVGGTGKYQMATGYVNATLVSSSDSSTWIEIKIISFPPVAAEMHASY